MSLCIPLNVYLPYALYYDYHLGPDSERLTFFREGKLLIIALTAARDEQEWAYGHLSTCCL